MTLRSVLGLRPKATTAAALHASLSETQAALSAVRAVAAELEAQRGAVLLDGSPAEAEAHEAKLLAAVTEAGRLASMAAALPARIEAAEAREHGLEMDKLSERTEADAAAGAAIVREISGALDRVATMIEQHDAVAARIMVANNALAASGRPRAVLPTRRVWPHDASRGVVHATLGDSTAFPGPRGPCTTFADWRAAVARGVVPPAD